MTVHEDKLNGYECAFRADGQPSKGQPVENRLWGRVQRCNECWEFTGQRDDKDYGVLRYRDGTEKAHRVAWILTTGDIPDGKVVCHHCDNPPCIRPAHLFLGTIADNNRDRANKGRSRGTFPSGATHPAKLRRGEQHWCARLSDADVRGMRALHAGGLTQVALGRIYGVNAATVSRIVRRIWRTDGDES